MRAFLHWLAADAPGVTQVSIFTAGRAVCVRQRLLPAGIVNIRTT